MDSGAGVDSMKAMMASMAALAVLVERSEGRSGSMSSNPLRDQADACLEGLEETARLEAMLAARKVRFAAGFADRTRAMAAPDEQPQERKAQEMAVVSEVACVLTVSERTAGALLAESHELTTTLPQTLAALQDGNISWQHARVMVDEASALDPTGAQALETHFLDPEAARAARSCLAGELIPGRLRHKARTWRERHHPVSIERRHAKSVLDRRLEYAPDRDGMAWLSAYLPADQAAGIWNRLTAAARALQGPHESRTLTQLRVDSFAAWLLTAGQDINTDFTADRTADRTTGAGTDRAADGIHVETEADGAPAGNVIAGDVTAGDAMAGRVPSPAAQVLVTVPVFALMGLTEEPAMLDGYGPVPPSMARNLVADGANSFHRVLTDPRDGAPLEIGRASYRIPAAMRQWLRMRDGKCPFPGCSNHSLDTEADHLLSWAEGGTTGITNLGQPCPKHHRLKHTTGWTPTTATKDKPPGWTSPTGRHYPSEHHDWEPPHWPPHILNQVLGQERGQATRGKSGLKPKPAMSEQSGLDRRRGFPALDDTIP